LVQSLAASGQRTRQDANAIFMNAWKISCLHSPVKVPFDPARQLTRREFEVNNPPM